MSKPRHRILITTGDRDGIGLEVTVKALMGLKKSRPFQFLIFIDHKDRSSSWIKKLCKEKAVSFVTEDLLVSSGSDAQFVVILSKNPPPLWVELATHLLNQKWADGLVTGPLSKPLISKSGLKDLGHTDILKRLTGSNSVHMGFVGHKFNVLLATGHIPLSEVSKKLSRESLLAALQNAVHFRGLLPLKSQKKPIAVLGLNPHAGDQGLIGQEEMKWLNKSIKDFSRSHKGIEGPLVPDAAFRQENWNKYSLFVCLYHDQGLIPFKAVHGAARGCHISLGLPIRRTSVDHGTAKDIFKKNLANPGSMKDAIEFMIGWVQQESRRV